MLERFPVRLQTAMGPMLRQSLSRRIAVVSTVAICLLGRFVLSACGQFAQALPSSGETRAASEAANEVPQAIAPDQNTTAPGVEQAFVGTNQCFVCHRPQANTWSETSHAQSFTHLPEKYRSDTSCLKCHVTGFGDARGYVTGTEKDLLMVGCESCHGPGAKHLDAAQRFLLASTPDEEAKIEKEMRETVVKTPTDEVCIACHTTQAHGSHPLYEDTLPAPPAKGQTGQRKLVSSISSVFASPSPTRYVPGYSVKTCGSCHYDQYLQWRTEKHSTLAASLPAKHANDQNCTNCHANAGFVDSTVSTDVHHAQIGVGCESCHGPALEHVRFNVRFIHGPRLGPQLEEAARQSISKGKPATACVQCHVGQSHKEHPQFEAN
jgi:hypothetical protein